MGVISRLMGSKPKPKEEELPGSDGKSKPSKTLVQRRALETLTPYSITEIHSDGDLTVESDGKEYICCTDGRIFKFVKMVNK